nr:thioesterase family protein [Xanthomonas arboricola]
MMVEHGFGDPYQQAPRSIVKFHHFLPIVGIGMNLWFRLMILFVTSLFRPRMQVRSDVSRLRLRVLPNDIDANLHMTNGRYWTIFDLGRLDMVLRTGLAKVAVRAKWAPIVGSGAIQFRRELKPFHAFDLETRLIGWSGTRLIVEQRIFTGSDKALAARGLLLIGFYDRGNRAFVKAETVLQSIGVVDTTSPPLGDAANALLAADAALKSEIDDWTERR